MPSDLRLFVGALSLFSLASGIVDPAFNNYVHDTFAMAADTRGQLEFPRELPGFLVMVTSGLLYFLPEGRTAFVAMAGAAAGIAGLALSGSHFGAMIACMILWSAGLHLLQPMRSAIILGFAPRDRQAAILGSTGSITTVAVVFGAAIAWFLFMFAPREPATYSAAFLGSAAVTALSALLVLRMRPPVHQAGPRPKLVFDWRYRLYYALSVLFGARKQIFMTFAPWVLITVFQRGPSTFAALSVLASLLGVPWNPLIGWLIDRCGERAVLVAEGLLLFGVCMGYGFAHRLGTGAGVLAIVYSCYVLDQLLFAVGMARTTLLSRTAARPEDVTASLSMGVTLDHAVSMSIPMLGGATWMAFGFEYVFVGAAVLALASSVVALFVPASAPLRAPLPAPGHRR